MPTPDQKSDPTPADTPAEDDRTIGQILGLAEAAPLPAPGFAAMADELEELRDPTAGVKPPKPAAQPPGMNPPVPQSPPGQPNAPRPVSDPTSVPEPNAPRMSPPAATVAEDDSSAIAALNEQRKRIYEEQRGRYGAEVERVAITPSDADITRGHVRYESRIQIVDAWQYPGRLTPATPDWIDRNWVGYADDDPVRQIAAGPCLRVPSSADPSEVVLARIGDYVCRQQVLTDDGPPVIRTEVWAAEQFQRLFVPVPVTPRAPLVPEDTAGSGTAPARPGPDVKRKTATTKPKSDAVKSSRQRSHGKKVASRSAA